jgi:hypothetical protein
MLNKAQKVILVFSTLLICIPAVEMIDGNNGIVWSLGDFLGAFLLLTTLGFSLEYVIRKIQTKMYRRIMVLFILFFFFLLWAEMAVGLFNSPIAGD